jgi:hypothetical protein
VDTKPCPACNGTMVLKSQPGTRDTRWGGSWYCENPACMYREWNTQPASFVPPVPESERAADWKIAEYEERKKTGPTIAQITPQVYLGDLIDAWLVRDQGTGKPFDAILNVSQKQYDPPKDVEYAQIPLTEYGSKPGKRNRRDRDFARAVQQLEDWVARGKTVFVHCVAGANRSAAVVTAFLADQGADLPNAMEDLQQKRPMAWPHGEIALTLRRYLRTKTEGSAAMTGDDPTPLQPTGKRAADEGAEFVSQADWAKTFETNYLRIEMSDAPLEEYDPAEPLFEPQTTGSERFVRTDVLITQAMGGQEQDFAMAAQREAALPRKKDTRTRSLFKSDKPEFLDLEEHPGKAIKRLSPDVAAKELLSRRGLKLPAPDVFNSERYQYVMSKAPLIPLDPKDPNTVDKCLAFVETTPGLLIGHKRETAGQYYLCPTKFGSKKIDHVMYASWFAIFSANTAVESEETSFVLWQAGASGNAPGKPGIMSKKPKIKEWLHFLKWAGFPTFKNMYKTLEGFDPSDESYARRLTALSRLPGMQMKVSSFFLALLGDVRSPTLDMHALGYLISKGEIQVPADKKWTDLSVLAELARDMKEINRDIGTNNYEYRAKRVQYDELAEQNKETVQRLMGSLKIKDQPPPTPKGMEGERKKVAEYMRRQLAGWDGKTNTFWLWYAQNMYFETHEPRRDMIHTVFFQSLFPELFTPEALAARDELFKKYSDPELVDEREERMKYRDFAENLMEMRKIQPHKNQPQLSEDFDWESGNVPVQELQPTPAPAPRKLKLAPKKLPTTFKTPQRGAA